MKMLSEKLLHLLGFLISVLGHAVVGALQGALETKPKKEPSFFDVVKRENQKDVEVATLGCWVTQDRR